jgi:hypothetical protein
MVCVCSPANTGEDQPSACMTLQGLAGRSSPTIVSVIVLLAVWPLAQLPGRTSAASIGDAKPQRQPMRAASNVLRTSGCRNPRIKHAYTQRTQYM